MGVNKEISEEQLTALLSELDKDIEVPFDAAAAWRVAVRKEAAKKHSRTRINRIASAAAAVLLVIGLTIVFRESGIIGSNPVSDKNSFSLYKADINENAGISLFDTDSSFESGEYAAEGACVEETPMAVPEVKASFNMPTLGFALESSAKSEAVETEAAETEEKEFEAYASLDIETAKINETVSFIRNTAGEYAGYVREETITSENADISVLVPEEAFDEFIAAVSDEYDNCIVNRYNKPVSELYIDATNRLESARNLAERLNELTETAEANEIDDLYANLNAVYDDIEGIEEEINRCEELQGYSVVEISVRSSTKLSKTFVNFYTRLFSFGKDAIISLCLILPAVILTAAVCFVIAGKKRKQQKSRHEK